MSESFFTGAGINGAQGAWDGCNGLHPRPDPQNATGGHTALDTACSFTRAFNTVGPTHDFIVCERATTPRRFEAVSNLNALDSLNSHQSRRKARIQASIPMHVGTEPRWQATDHNFHYSSEGVTLFVGGIDFFDHGCGCFLVCTAQWIFVQANNIRRGGKSCALRDLNSAHSNSVSNDIDPERGE
jgi:hypothetical protein